MLCECLWKKPTGDSGGIWTHDLLLTRADVLTSQPPSLPDDNWPARIIYSSGSQRKHFIKLLALMLFLGSQIIMSEVHPSIAHTLGEGFLLPVTTLPHGSSYKFPLFIIVNIIQQRWTNTAPKVISTLLFVLKQIKECTYCWWFILKNLSKQPVGRKR